MQCAPEKLSLETVEDCRSPFEFADHKNAVCTCIHWCINETLGFEPAAKAITALVSSTNMSKKKTITRVHPKCLVWDGTSPFDLGAPHRHKHRFAWFGFSLIKDCLFQAFNKEIKCLIKLFSFVTLHHLCMFERNGNQRIWGDILSSAAPGNSWGHSSQVWRVYDKLLDKPWTGASNVGGRDSVRKPSRSVKGF